MDSPAMMIAAVMVGGGALAMIFGLAVAGLQWQDDSPEPYAEQPERPASRLTPAARRRLQRVDPHPVPVSRPDRSLRRPTLPTINGVLRVNGTPGPLGLPGPASLPTPLSLPGPAGSAGLAGAPGLADGSDLMGGSGQVGSSGLAGVPGQLGVGGSAWGSGPRVAGPGALAGPVKGGNGRVPRQRRAARAAGAQARVSQRMRLGAYAVAAAQRAAQARADAEAARAQAAQAEVARDEAWRALEAVDSRPEPVEPEPAAAAVDPAVTQAAFAAFRRGDITVDELRRVWGRAEDRDPQAAARESRRRQRMALSRAARQTYERASADARLAEERAQIAEVAAQALATEAEEAARDAAASTPA